MDKKKQKVNVKAFLNDYRSGMVDTELMSMHGLTASTLAKLLKVLQEKELLHASEVRPAGPALGSQRGPGTTSSREGRRPVAPPVVQDLPDDVSDSAFRCQQCGAAVAGKMLTCPECGHVLPGEERWSNLEPEKSLLHRMPPWVVGCIIALPIAIGLFFVFKYILVPMSSASIQQRSKSQFRAMSPKQGLAAARDQAGKASVLPIQKEVDALISEGVISAASSDYAGFTVTDRWFDLPREHKIKHIARVGSALVASGLMARFQVFSPAGDLVARVSASSVDLIDKDGFTDTVDRADYEFTAAGSEGE
jgi:hypothetical protein